MTSVEVVTAFRELLVLFQFELQGTGKHSFRSKPYKIVSHDILNDRVSLSQQKAACGSLTLLTI